MSPFCEKNVHNSLSSCAKHVYMYTMAGPDVSLKFDCPTCGAEPGQKCRSHRLSDRCESHQERWDVAADYRPKPGRTLALVTNPNDKGQTTPAKMKQPAAIASE